MNIEALNDNVIVSPDKSDIDQKMEKSGLTVPESKSTVKTGKVIETGPGKYKDGEWIDTGVRPGDSIIFHPYGFEEVEIEDKKYYIMQSSNIVARIIEETNQE